MSLKVHFLEVYLSFFSQQFEKYFSNEHGERFYQHAAIIEIRFEGKCFVGMLADYCWSIKLDTSELLHK